MDVCNDPFEVADSPHILEYVDSLSLHLNGTGADESALPEIRSKRLDVLLDLTTAQVARHFDVAKYGTWSYSYNYLSHPRQTPPYYEELLTGHPLSRTTLLVSRGQCDSPDALAGAAFATQPGVSFLLNQLQPYWSSTHLVIQKLWELHIFGWEFVEKRISPICAKDRPNSDRVKLNNTQLFSWLAPRIAKKVWNRVRRTATGQEQVLHWRIAVRVGERNIGFQNQVPDTSGFQWIESPKGHFYADPFVFQRDGDHWLFFEDYSYSVKRGTIACAEVSQDGQVGPPQLSVGSPFHMSYPYIFEDHGRIYMIPETASVNSIRLYRCERFPDRWSPVRELFQGPALDTSVCKHDGLWWFFTTMQDPRAYGVVLYLFFSEDLFGKWYYHPANPISLDARNARGAGRVFHDGDRLIRPSQSATPRYGYSFSFNVVVKLTPTEYEEHPILSVPPTCFPGLLATHTYNRSGSVEVIDGQVLRDRSLL